LKLDFHHGKIGKNDDLSGIRMGKLGEKIMILNMSNRRNNEQWDYNGISLGLYDIIGGYNGIYIYDKP
jgi:hypothetical protein